MIIGFDAKRANANFTGLGNYSRFMVDTMATYGDEHKYRMYIPKQCKNASYDSLLKHKNVSSILPRSSVMKRFRALWRTFFIKRGLLQDGVQLYHGLSNELPVGIHRTGIRSVVTIHDLIFLRYPQYYHRLDRIIYNRKFNYACRKADRIVAVSECTKRDIVKFYGISPEKIDVVYQGCDPVFARPVSKKEKDRVRAAYGLPERFILSVGTIEERKNLLLAVKAVEKLDDVHLVAIGKSTDYAKKVQDYVEAHGLENRVHIIHNLKFADIVSSGLVVRISFSFRGVRNSHCRSSFGRGSGYRFHRFLFGRSRRRTLDLRRSRRCGRYGECHEKSTCRRAFASGDDRKRERICGSFRSENVGRRDECRISEMF